MKHLAVIQSEYLRLAKTITPKTTTSPIDKLPPQKRKKWFRLPIYRQQKYLEQHPGSKQKLTGKQNFKFKHKNIMRHPRKPKVHHLKNVTSERHLLNHKQHFTQA
jgi:hypothetical protein